MLRVFIICLLLTGFQLKAKHQKLSLQKAINMKLVKAKATSLGGYQGFCMRMGIKNLSQDSLVILIEAGRRLNSVDENNQDILIVKEELIVLRHGEEKQVNVKGYCCQSTNRAPSKNAVYDVNKLADSGLVRVARYLNTHSFDKNTEQNAIWAVSDKHATAGITASNDSLVMPLRRMVAGIKGEKLPWYTIVSTTYVYSNGAISVFPLQLKGKMEYDNEKDSYVTLSVVNEKGMPVCLVKKQWLKAATNSNYDLNLPIKGLAKGKYTIELKSTEKQLAIKEFEI